MIKFNAIQRQTVSGAPLTHHNITVTPQSEVVTLKLPYGGVVWNRPTGILIEQDSKVETISIADPTRWILIAARVLSTLFMLITIDLTIRIFLQGGFQR
ncbi:hypothetical protein QUF64_03360 [Anaerolineales bacterium HSG6]|nr:hypothetical protein [Anaerolineales bacterium HSG6]MDM8531597.1 hypothetical protein [Anaerolineales bacterium HSG25]